MTEESTNRLTGLIDNLFDSSRLSAGAVRPMIRPVGYDEIVAHALSMDGQERIVANVVDNAFRHGVLATPRPIDVDGDGRISENGPWSPCAATPTTTGSN